MRASAVTLVKSDERCLCQGDSPRQCQMFEHVIWTSMSPYSSVVM